MVVRTKDNSAEKASGGFLHRSGTDQAPSLPASAQVPNQPATVLGRLVTTFLTVNRSFPVLHALHPSLEFLIYSSLRSIRS